MENHDPGSKYWVNYLKGWAIVAVVIIHIVNNFLGTQIANTAVARDVLTSLDQVARFCVPFFVLLSGFALTKKYITIKFSAKEYYLNRVLRLLPLYLVWTAIYVLYGKIYSGFANWGNIGDWINIIALGRGYYHLYFVPMIFTAYVIFPVIYFVVKKYPLISLAVSTIAQIGIFHLISGPGWTDQRQYVLFSTWQVYFVLGIFLGLSRIDFKNTLKLVAPAVTLAGLAGSIINSLNLINTGFDQIWATRFTRWPVFFYSIGLMATAMVPDYWSHTMERLKSSMAFLGKHSYLIYLSHVLFLQLLFSPSLSSKPMQVLGIGIAGIWISTKLKG